MKRLAIDTNALIDLLEKGNRPPESFLEYGELIVPATVLGEYRAGLSNTKRGQSMLWKMQCFLAKSSVKTVPIGEQTAEPPSLREFSDTGFTGWTGFLWRKVRSKKGRSKKCGCDAERRGE